MSKPAWEEYADTEKHDSTYDGIEIPYENETYLGQKLATSQKVAKGVYDKFKTEYDGISQWGLANAITDKAHDLSDAERLRFETIAMKVA